MTVGSGGTLASGNPTSFGFLVANGDVTFQAGSNYAVRVSASNQNDLVLSLGSATLNGGTVQVFPTGVPGDYAARTRYLIFNAQNGLVGTFAGVTANFAFLTPTLSYDRNNVFLDLGNPLFTQAATDPGSSAVAAALQAAYHRGERGGLFDDLLDLPEAQGARALRSLSGAATSASQQASVGAGRLFASVLDTQTSSWIVGGPSGGNSVTLSQTLPIFTQLQTDPATPSTTATPPAPEREGIDYIRQRTWRAWSSGFTGALSVGDTPGSGQARSHTHLVAGS